jgi:hypothetical protein
MFNHCPPKQLLELTTENVNGKRYYLTPNGHYPSITSVLSAFPKPALMEWKESVGEKEANRITRTAASRGKKLHSICEQYLLNEEIDKSKYMPDTLYSFYQFKSLLNKISDIHFLEAPLYSDKLKVAGRVDCIGYYEGDLSIIDFKTSRREKNEEWIEDYFIQACFYSLCYAELTGIVAKNIVILISVEDGENQVFVKKPKEYIPKTVKKIKDYYKFYHKDC